MTDETKYTPGPWKAVKTAHGPIDIVIPDGRDIVTVYGGGAGSKEANAALMAAAPELIEAMPDLRPVIAWLSNGCDPLKAVDELKIYQSRIDSAKAKAVGE